MADGAGKLNKLARLKTLKSGLKSKGEAPADNEETLDLDVLFEEPGDETPPPSRESEPVRKAPSLESAPQPVDPNTESLSAYFEALGIVPDSAKMAGATGTAPKPYTPNPLTDPAPEPAKPKPPVKGREVDARDRWADPVREDNAFLASFAGETPQVDEGTAPPDPVAATFDEEAISDIAPEEEALPDIEPAAIADEPEESTEIPDDILTLGDPAEEFASSDPDDDEPEEFGSEIDIEAFEREIALAEEARTKSKASSRDMAAPEPEAQHEPEPEPEIAAADDADKPLTVTFDENRAALLRQVSKQMECSIDDVVVTALDWYLDALFGEENAEQEAGAAE